MRRKSSPPKSFSSRFMARDIVGWETPSLFAAFVKLAASATARKYRTALKFIPAASLDHLISRRAAVRLPYRHEALEGPHPRRGSTHLLSSLTISLASALRNENRKPRAREYRARNNQDCSNTCVHRRPLKNSALVLENAIWGRRGRQAGRCCALEGCHAHVRMASAPVLEAVGQ